MIDMGENNNMNLTEYDKRIDEINQLNKPEERVAACRKLFADIMNSGELYLIAAAETPMDMWNKGQFQPHIAKANKDEKYYLRLFSDYELACKAARRIKSVDDTDKEMVVKIEVKQLISMVKDYFVLGVYGVLLNDGDKWITFSNDAFLHTAFYDVLKQPERFDASFVNTVRAIYDIVDKRVRLVAPFKYQEGIEDRDVFEDGIEFNTLDNGLLIMEFYDKYKVEKSFKEKVYWVDLDIEKFCKVIIKALQDELKVVNIVYGGRQGSGTPKNIATLLQALGYIENKAQA